MVCEEKRVMDPYALCFNLSPASFQLLTPNITPPTHRHTPPTSSLSVPKLFGTFIEMYRVLYSNAEFSLLCVFVCEGHETAGMVSVRAVYEIAQVKAEDDCFKMRNTPLQTVVKNIIGSARSLGIQIVNE